MAQAPARFAAVYEAGDAWLADCHAHPAHVRTAWEAHTLAPLTTGTLWLTAVGRLVDSVQALYRMPADQRGPVLADAATDRAWWLVPLSAAEDLAHVRRLRIQPAGTLLCCPPCGWQVAGRFWILRPDGSGYLTDPSLLAATFGPGGYRHETEAP